MVRCQKQCNSRPMIQVFTMSADTSSSTIATWRRCLTRRRWNQTTLAVTLAKTLGWWSAMRSLQTCRGQHSSWARRRRRYGTGAQTRYARLCLMLPVRASAAYDACLKIASYILAGVAVGACPTLPIPPLSTPGSVDTVTVTLWCPLLPYGYNYKVSCARPG